MTPSVPLYEIGTLVVLLVLPQSIICDQTCPSICRSESLCHIRVAGATCDWLGTDIQMAFFEFEDFKHKLLCPKTLAKRRKWASDRKMWKKWSTSVNYGERHQVSGKLHLEDHATPWIKLGLARQKQKTKRRKPSNSADLTNTSAPPPDGLDLQYLLAYLLSSTYLASIINNKLRRCINPVISLPSYRGLNVTFVDHL